MGLQSLCCSFSSPKISHFSFTNLVSTGTITGGNKRIQFTNAQKSYPISGLRWSDRGSQLRKLKGISIVCASPSDSKQNLEVQHSDFDVKLRPSSNSSSSVPETRLGGVESFRGKPGSISFYGVTHQVIEESKLASLPDSDGGGSLLWVLAPAVLMLSFALPQLYVANVVANFFSEGLLSETVVALTSEAGLYVGVAMFLLITDRVQRPYLQFSSNRWSLITGLKGFLTASSFSMALKVFAPLMVTFVTQPFLGYQPLILITPLLVGYVAQLALEIFADKQGSSCWPIVPIIFEVYRLYQLARGVVFVDKLMFMMRGMEATPLIMDRTHALVVMTMAFEAIAVVSLWSLLTFLLRLFPSRPVAEKY